MDKCPRTKGHHHTSKEKVKIVDIVTDIVSGEGLRHTFTTAEETRIKQRRTDN
jgi:hypothetical protein